MGWTGEFVTHNPTMKERTEKIVTYFTFTSDNTESTVVKSTYRGSNVFLLVSNKNIETNEETIYPIQVLTRYENGELFTKDVDPTDCELTFPVSWIDHITEDDTFHTRETLNNWKNHIIERQENTTFLKEAPIGTQIMTKDDHRILTQGYGRTPRSKKVRQLWIDKEQGYYVPTKDILVTGFEIVNK